MLSQVVSKDEVGKIFSINALIGAALGSSVSASYTKLYNLTLDTFPGAYLLVACGLVLLTIPINIILRKLMSTFAKFGEKDNEQIEITQL